MPDNCRNLFLKSSYLGSLCSRPSRYSWFPRETRSSGATLQGKDVMLVPHGFSWQCLEHLKGKWCPIVTAGASVCVCVSLQLPATCTGVANESLRWRCVNVCRSGRVRRNPCSCTCIRPSLKSWITCVAKVLYCCSPGLTSWPALC